MRGMFQLPNFTVVVWVQKTDYYDTIRDIGAKLPCAEIRLFARNPGY